MGEAGELKIATEASPTLRLLEEGAMHALAHAARLLEDAALLHSAARYSSAFHLAVMAREELGRSHLLEAQAADVRERGGEVDLAELAKKLRHHEQKLAAGIATFELEIPASQMEERTAALASGDQGRIRAAQAVVRAHVEKTKERAPRELHRRCLRSQYVELNAARDGWELPTSFTSEESRVLIITVTAEIANVLLAVRELSVVSAIAIPDMGLFTAAIHRLLNEPTA